MVTNLCSSGGPCAFLVSLFVLLCPPSYWCLWCLCSSKSPPYHLLILLLLQMLRLNLSASYFSPLHLSDICPITGHILLLFLSRLIVLKGHFKSQREFLHYFFFSKSLFKSFLSRSPTAPIKSLLETFISFPKPSSCLSFPKCHKGDFKNIERLFHKIFPSIHLLFS